MFYLLLLHQIYNYAEPAGEMIIGPSAIHRARKDNRAALAAMIRESFNPKALTIHWDGKIMTDVTGTERGCVNRLPIMVSGKDVTKLLAIPNSNTGQLQSCQMLVWLR